jgi:hypothetical protein
VVELLQEHYLTVGTLCVRRVLECVEDLFQGEDLAGLTVFHFPDVPVGSAPDLLQQFVSFQDVRLYLFFHAC